MATSAAATVAASTVGAGAPTSIDDSAFRRLFARWRAAAAARDRLLEECYRPASSGRADRADWARLKAASDVQIAIEGQLAELLMRRLHQPIPAYDDERLTLKISGHVFVFERHHSDKTRLVSLEAIPPERSLTIE